MRGFLFFFGGGGGGGGGLFLQKLNVSEACAPLSHNQIWYRIVVYSLWNGETFHSHWVMIKG